MNWIDSHAHLYLKAFDEDREEVVARAKAQHLSKVLMPNIDQGSIESMLKMEVDYPDYCIAMMGLHPCSVAANYEEELAIVEGWINKRDFIAIGEIGIDLYWDKTFQKEQVMAFEKQINWAKEKGWPIVIHSRDSLDMCIEVVQSHKGNDLTGVFHCFNGDVKQAEQIKELGFLVGLGGVSTFKNGGMDKVIPFLGLDQIILETDAPYLTPTPYRGKRNESSYVPIIAEVVARHLGVELAQLAKSTNENCEKLFDL